MLMQIAIPLLEAYGSINPLLVIIADWEFECFRKGLQLIISVSRSSQIGVGAI